MMWFCVIRLYLWRNIFRSRRIDGYGQLLLKEVINAISAFFIILLSSWPFPCLYELLDKLVFYQGFWWSLKKKIPYDIRYNYIHSLTCFGVDKDRGFATSNNLSIAFHYLQICSDIGSDIYLVYYEKIATLYSQSPFSRILVSTCYINYIDKIVSKSGTKSSCNVIAAALYQDQI